MTPTTTTMTAVTTAVAVADAVDDKCKGIHGHFNLALMLIDIAVNATGSCKSSGRRTM